MGLYTATHNATPSTPSAGQSTLYPKSDDLWYYVDDNGNERALLAGAAIVANRVPYTSGTGIFTSSANLTFDGTTLTAHTLTVSTGALTVAAGGSSITSTANTKVISILAASGGDQFYVKPQAAGSGVELFVRNNADSVYEPLNIYADEITLRYGAGTAGITLNSSGNTTLAGTLTVSGNTLSGSGAGTLRADGGLRIGADSTNNLIDDASTGAGTATLYIGNASINVTSDERVKTDIRLWDGDASNLLRSLPVKEFGYSSNEPMGGYGGKYVGFTAQDIHLIAPWAINTQGDTGLPWQARYEFLNGLIVKSWQEHDERIKALEERIK